MKRRFISFILAAAMVAAMIPMSTPITKAAEYTVAVVGYSIYANGTPLLITDGTKENTTSIYIDANKNGKADDGELTLAGAGIENALADNLGNDSSSLYTIYGGAYRQDFSGDSYIVMTGGSIAGIYGGNAANRYAVNVGNFSGTTYIKITRGKIRENVYLGNYNPISTITATNSTKGTLIVSGNPEIRWDISGGSNAGNLNFTGVTTGFVLQPPSTTAGSVVTDTYHNGILKTDATTYITKGTATAPADLPITIAAGETMTVVAGSNITISGQFINNGTLIIEAGATLTLTGSGNTNNGTITNNGTLNCKNHSYSDGCDADCNFCGATRSASHAWKNATCEAPKACSKCGTTSGTALGHSLRYETVDSFVVESCANNCGHRATVGFSTEMPTTYTYTGSPIAPVEVIYSDNWKGPKLTVEYGNNVDAGVVRPTISIGSVQLGTVFSIEPRDLADAEVILTPESAVYNGQTQIPGFVVMLDGKVLTKDVDYVMAINSRRVIYSGTYEFTATGMVNYTGKKVQTYEILKADFTEVTIEPVGTYVYNGERQVPVVTTSALSGDGQAVQFLYGKSLYGVYREEVPYFTEAGTHTVYYWLKANDHNDYNGEFTFTIEKAPLEAPTLESKVYNGQQQIADIVSTDLYTVRVNDGGIEAGEYEVVLQLRDSANYRWSTTDSTDLTLTFTITPAENSWVNEPSIAGWSYGQRPNAPIAEPKYGQVEVTYTGTGNDGVPYSGTEAPTKAGSYTAIFRVAASDSYGSLGRTVNFTIEKSNYNLSAVRWDYTAAFAYDGLEKTVTLIGLPLGVTAQYVGNTAKQVGEYTAAATLTYDSYNYNQPTVEALTWSISNNWTPAEFSLSAPNGNGWLKENLVIAAHEGYLVATHNTAEGVWGSELTYRDETDAGSVTIYLKNVENGTISLGRTISYKLDQTIPTGKLRFMDRPFWESFVNTITFGLFYREEISVVVEAADSLSGIDHVEYTWADKALTLDEVKAITEWHAYTGAIAVALEDSKQFVYFARITDRAGNVLYLSTDGAQYDTTAPAVGTVTNGKTYYTTQIVTVTDKNLETVSVNGTLAAPTVSLSGNREATYVIFARDKAGNTTTVTVAMQPISGLAEPLNGLTTDNVNSDHVRILDSVKNAVANVDTTNATDEEKQALQGILSKVEQLEKVVADCRAEISRIQACVNAYDTATVTSDDLAALEKLAKDIKVLTDGNNITAEEEKGLQNALDSIAKLQKVVADFQAEISRIQACVNTYDTATVTSDDLAALEKLAKDIKVLTDGNNITAEEEKGLQNALNSIAKLQKVVADCQAEVSRIQACVNAYDTATITSDDLASLEKLVKDIQVLTDGGSIATEDAMVLTSGSNITAEEEKGLQNALDSIAKLQKVVADCQAEISRIQAAFEKYDAAKVNSDDLTELQKLAQDIQVLTDGENLADAERTALTQQAEGIAEMQSAIAKTQGENKRIRNAVAGYHLETVTSAHKNALEKLLEEIQKQLRSSHLTGAETAQLNRDKETTESLLAKIESTDKTMQKLLDTVAGYREESVKSTDRATLEQTVREVEALLKTENITAAEAASLEEAKAKAEAMLETIRVAEDAANADHAEKTKAITSENVTPEDRSDLEKAKEELEKALTENTGNYTDGEAQAIRDAIARIEGALEAIENVKAVEAQIQVLPQNIDRTHDGEVAAIQQALRALSDHERSLVKVELKQALADAAKAVERSQQNFQILIIAMIVLAIGALVAIPIIIKGKKR